MKAYQPRETQTYGYDNTCLSFDPTGTLIVGYDGWAAYTTSGRGANGILTSTPSASGTMLRQLQNAYTVTTAAQAGSGSEHIADDPNAYWNAASPRFLHLLASASISGAGTGALSTYAYDGNANPVQQARWDSTKATSKPSTLNTSSESIMSQTDTTCDLTRRPISIASFTANRAPAPCATNASSRPPIRVSSFNPPQSAGYPTTQTQPHFSAP